MIKTHSHFFKKATWKKKFVYLPKECCVTGQKIWLVHAWKGIAKWGKNTEVRWVAREQHTVPRKPHKAINAYEWEDIKGGPTIRHTTLPSIEYEWEDRNFS